MSNQTKKSLELICIIKISQQQSDLINDLIEYSNDVREYNHTREQDKGTKQPLKGTFGIHVAKPYSR